MLHYYDFILNPLFFIPTNLYLLLIKIFSQIYISIYIYLSSPLFFSSLSPVKPNFLLIYILPTFLSHSLPPLYFIPSFPLVMLKMIIFPSELFYWPNLVKNQQLNLNNRCLSSKFKTFFAIFPSFPLSYSVTGQLLLSLNLYYRFVTANQSNYLFWCLHERVGLNLKSE